MRYIYLFTLIVLCSLSAQAQFKGIWNGYLDAEGKEWSSGYLLNITEEKDGIVSGEAYLYGTNILKFLGKLDFIGTIEGNKIKFMELKILINNRPITNEGFCFKDMDLTLSVTDTLSSLIGPWEGELSELEKCNPGFAYLYKMNKDSTCQIPIPKYVLDYINKNKSPVKFLNTELSSPYIVFVKSRKVDVKLTDYDQNDKDIVSVYLNRRLVAEKVRIKPKPTIVSAILNPSFFIQEMVVYAHNVGKIPPNTCLLEVDDGFSIQQVYISSSLQKSALIYFKYEDSQ